MVRSVVTGAAAVLLIGLLTSCEPFIAIFTPCSNPIFGCRMEEAVSQPPHDNPVSSSLATPTPVDEINDRLTKMVRAQYAALGDRWPQEPSCQSIASVGCSYLVTLRYPRMQAPTCRNMLFLVDRGTGRGPVVVMKDPPGLITLNDCEKRSSSSQGARQ